MIERIVFLQPRTFAERNYLNADHREQTWIPWFALLLANIARKAGIEVDLIDARANPEWLNGVDHLDDHDLLAVSVMTGRAIDDAVQASHRARERNAKVVWGGPHVTLFAYDTLREAPVDLLVPGFGLYAFAELVELLAGSAWPYSQPRILLPTRVSLTKLVPIEHQRLPFDFALDLIRSWSAYVNSDIAIASRTVNLITSEGCSRKCTYCSEPRTSFGRWLTYDVDRVVRIAHELSVLSGANGVKLHDPNFFDDYDRAREFASSFKQTVNLPWAATMHPADLSKITVDQLRELSVAGLCRVLVGLESPIPKLVRLAGKQYDPAQIPALVQKLAAARIRGMFTFIVGWPGADREHYARTIDCARKIREIWSEHQAKIHFLEPWPGTPIFNLLERAGFKSPRSLAEWAAIDYYQARYAQLHDAEQVVEIRRANQELSPYVDA